MSYAQPTIEDAKASAKAAQDAAMRASEVYRLRLDALERAKNLGNRSEADLRLLTAFVNMAQRTMNFWAGQVCAWGEVVVPDSASSGNVRHG